MVSTVLGITGWVVLGLVFLTALVLDVLGLFGNWVILLGITAAGLVTKFELFPWWVLIILLILAVVGEVLEALSGWLGARHLGGSSVTFWPPLVGGLVGAGLGTMVFPIFGLVVGAFAGCFLGVFLYENQKHRRDVQASARAGLGATLGRLGGAAAKVCIGVVMIALFLFSVWGSKERPGSETQGLQGVDEAVDLVVGSHSDPQAIV